MSEINWQAFCKKEHGRYDMSAPFVKNKWKIATDARIAICFPSNEADTVSLGILAPVRKVFDIHWPKFIGEMIPFPVHSGKRIESNCSWCSGRKYEWADCDCGDDDCEASASCMKCGGYGEYKTDTPCHFCEGEGKPFEGMTICGAFISGYYARLADTLPDCRIIKDFEVKNSITPLPFVFAEFGQGLIMPVRELNG